MKNVIIDSVYMPIYCYSLCIFLMNLSEHCNSHKSFSTSEDIFYPVLPNSLSFPKQNCCKHDHYLLTLPYVSPLPSPLWPPLISFSPSLSSSIHLSNLMSSPYSLCLTSLFPSLILPLSFSISLYMKFNIGWCDFASPSWFPYLLSWPRNQVWECK